MTIWHMGMASWITMATNTHSEYVILIAFPQQQWLGESFSVLRYVYSLSCVVILIFFMHYMFYKLIAGLCYLS